MRHIMRTTLGRFALLALALCLPGTLPGTARAQSTPPGTNVSVSGGAAPGAQRVPDGQIDFTVNVPLKPNADNVLTLSATDARGRNATAPNVSVTQLTLTDIVQARVTATRLTPQEVRALVADGTISLADPANYNVSRFVIVLTVGGQPVEVAVPVVRQKDAEIAEGPAVSIGCAAPGQGLSTSDRAIAVPCGDGGGGSAADAPPIVIVPFETVVSGVPGKPSIPGVIVIEGRLKTLKEFFRVTLHLLNVSSLFTLTDLEATLEVPEGKLAHVAPASGVVKIGELAPGTEGLGEFVVRGDEIGTHTVTAHFGGKITSAFLSEPVPISGSASTDLEVRGAPNLGVTLTHPDYVQAGEPYTLTVAITNTDVELNALYASLALDIGADARLLDEQTGDPLPGPVTRSLGDILHGEKTVQTYRVLPLVSGPIVSCTAAASQNIHLTVDFAGSRGPDCAIGTLPAERKSPDGRPTVTVVPAHNTTGVTTAPAIVALFSAPMIASTITSGFPEATFRLLDSAGNIIAGTLTFGTIFEGTSAIFRPSAPLADGQVYTIVIDPLIFSEEGLQLASGIISRFTTGKPAPQPDTEAPRVTIDVEAPLTATSVPRGQLVGVLAAPTDNQGVTRVDLYLDDRLVDTRRGGPNSLRFLVETASLAPSSRHQLRAVVLDAANNQGTASLDITIAPDLTPPTVSLVLPAAIGRGAPLRVEVHAADDGRVARVDLYLDGNVEALWSGLLAPFHTTLATTGLVAGTHLLRAVATDGAGNQAATESAVEITVDAIPPVVTIAQPRAGAEVRSGSLLQMAANATDNLGIASVAIYLDAEATPRLVGTTGLAIDTTGLALGGHLVRAVATDVSGNTAEASVPFTIVNTPQDRTAPDAPKAALIAPTLATAPTNVATLTGAAGAVEANAGVVVTNAANQAAAETVASAAGTFVAQIDANPGDMLAVVAIDAAGNQSPATMIRVPDPLTITSVDVSPLTIVLNRATTSTQITVVAHYSDGSAAPLAGTGRVTFTSSAPSIASVDVNGLVLPGSNGSATITVTVLGSGLPAITLSATTSFPTVTGVTISPATIALAGTGRTQRLTAIAQLSDNTTETFRGSVSYGSQNVGIAIVDSSGLVTATGIGSTAIVAVPSGFAPITTPVTVADRTPTQLLPSPSSLSLSAIGQTATVTVSTQFSDGSTSQGTGGVVFSSRDTAIATIDAGGVVRAVGEGTTTIDIVALGLTATVPVAVDLPTQLPPPILESLGRPIAGEGDTLVLLGKHFSPLPEENVVTLNGATASVLSAESDRLIVRVPRGATTGPVMATVVGQVSNALQEQIYPRRAAVAGSTPAFDVTNATPGQQAQIGPFALDVRAGDVVWLTGHPQTVAGRQFSGLPGPAFIGTLRLTIDGATFTFTPSATPIDLASLVAPGDHTVTVTLEEAGGRLSTQGLAVVGGPSNSGALIGDWSVPGDIHGQPLSVRFTQLTANNGQPIGDGATLGVVTTNFANVDGACCNNSAGGTITNGSPSPSDGRVRLITVANGALTVEYSDAGLYTPFAQARQSVLSIVLTDGNGNITDGRPIAAATIALAAVDSASVIPAQTSLIADGADRPIPVEVNSVRDTLGDRVPDGARVALTAANFFNRLDGGCCNNSPGGAIIGGTAAPNDGRFRSFVLADGAAHTFYSPSGIQLAVGDVRTAVIAVVVADGNDATVEARPFAEGRVTLSSAGASGGTASVVPTSLAATTADNRAIITVSGLADATGRVLPDGTQIGVTASNWYNVSDGGCCNNSVGGAILSGTTAPNDGRIQLHSVHGGAITITYSAAGLGLRPRETRTAYVSLLPSNTAGPIGSQPFMALPITLSGISGATITPAVTTTLADGVTRPIAVAVTNIVDALGIPVPDGTRIALTGSNWYNVSDVGCCNNSAGGRLIDGDQTPNDGRFRTFIVTNGRVDATFTADTVPRLGVTDQRTSLISAVVADPAGNRVFEAPFAVGGSAVSSTSGGDITTTPNMLLADGQDRRATIRVTNLADGRGQLIPDGTRVALTAANWYKVADGGCCNDSLGGAIVDGVPAPNDGRFRSFVVSQGAIQATYSDAGLIRQSGQSGTAIVSVMPADGNGAVIGSRPLLSVPITLAGLGSATVSAPATVPPGGTVTVTLSEIRDVAGQVVPDGTRIALTTINWYQTDGSCCNGSAGGTLTGGVAGNNDGNFRVLTVSGGSISVTFQAPAANNVTSVIAATSADGQNNRVTDAPFVAVAIRVTSTP